MKYLIFFLLTSCYVPLSERAYWTAVTCPNLLISPSKFEEYSKKDEKCRGWAFILFKNHRDFKENVELLCYRCTTGKIRGEECNLYFKNRDPETCDKYGITEIVE